MRTLSIDPDAVGTTERGFTLIEMLVTLSLIALIAAFALPRIASTPATGRPATLARIETEIAKARAAALKGQRVVRIETASLAPGFRFTPALGEESRLVFYRDGTSNGGTIGTDNRAMLVVDWLTGQVRHADH